MAPLYNNSTECTELYEKEEAPSGLREIPPKICKNSFSILTIALHHIHMPVRKWHKYKSKSSQHQVHIHREGDG
jgi:hypothetical protein